MFLCVCDETTRFHLTSYYLVSLCAVTDLSSASKNNLFSFSVFAPCMSPALMRRRTLCPEHGRCCDTVCPLIYSRPAQNLCAHCVGRSTELMKTSRIHWSATFLFCENIYHFQNSSNTHSAFSFRPLPQSAALFFPLHVNTQHQHVREFDVWFVFPSVMVHSPAFLFRLWGCSWSFF